MAATLLRQIEIPPLSKGAAIGKLIDEIKHGQKENGQLLIQAIWFQDLVEYNDEEFYRVWYGVEGDEEELAKSIMERTVEEYCEFNGV